MSRLRTPLMKHFGEQGQLHPGPLTWPGDVQGRPLLGARPPLLKDEEFEEVQSCPYFRCRMFVLDDPADPTTAERHRQEYTEICDHIATNFFVEKHRRELLPTPTDPRFRIWLEWYQVYATLPDKRGDEMTYA